MLQCSKDKDRSLPETRLGLAENIGSKNGLRDTNLLDCEKAMPMSDLYGPRNVITMTNFRNVRPSHNDIILDRRFAVVLKPSEQVEQGEYMMLYHDMLLWSGAASEVSGSMMLPNLNLVIIENNYKT